MPVALKYHSIDDGTYWETEEKILQVDKQLQTIQADKTPLLTQLYQTVGSASVGNTLFYHHEDEIVPDTMTLTAVSAVNTDTLTVANDYANMIHKDIWMNERTKELIIIDDETISASATTIIRPVGGTTEVDMAIGDTMRKISACFPEGGTAPSAQMTVAIKKSWTTQYQRRVVELTTHMQAMAKRYGSMRAHEIWKKTAEMKRTLEFMLFFSGYSTDSTAGGTAKDRVSAGLFNTITTNVEGNMGSLTLGELRDIADAPRKYHSSGRFRMYTSPKVFGIINDLCEDKIRITPSTRAYGLNIKTLELGKSTIILEEQPAWTTTYLSRLAFILPDPVQKFIRIRTFKGDKFNGDLIWTMDIKKNDNNQTIKDELTCDKGLQVYQEQRCALIDGITG